MPRPAAGLARLRAHAIARSLFRPRPLRSAIERLGFVQADPIRAPARAQDLILRHRVADYRAGDLERRYPALRLEEDDIYNYAFVPREVWELTRPRPVPQLAPLEERLLAALRSADAVHPRDVDAEFGRSRVVNAWGGTSAATTRSLERLRRYGLARVVRRDAGVRVYAAVAPHESARSPEERFDALVLVFANALQPVPEATLSAIAASFRDRIPADHRAAIRGLVEDGRLERRAIDGRTYLWPAGRVIAAEPAPVVRFLAPFDPVVRDRDRFEHLWNWNYRFEAYTPAHKRVRGYYALPLLWRDAVIGWANASTAGGSLAVDVGFVDGRPKERAFRIELDAEIARLESFLAPR